MYVRSLAPAAVHYVRGPAIRIVLRVEFHEFLTNVNVKAGIGTGLFHESQATLSRSLYKAMRTLRI